MKLPEKEMRSLEFHEKERRSRERMRTENERRERIATACMAGLLANSDFDETFNETAKNACAAASALMRQLDEIERKRSGT